MEARIINVELEAVGEFVAGQDLVVAALVEFSQATGLENVFLLVEKTGADAAWENSSNSVGRATLP